MGRFQISGRGTPAVVVEAGNWLTALGLGLDQLDAVSALDRLACEVLQNGTVIARDARTGSGFVVVPLQDPVPVPIGADEPPLEADSGGVDPGLGGDPDDEPTFVSEPDSAELALALAEGVEDYGDEEDTAELNKRAVRTLVATVRETPTPGVAWERALEVAQTLVPSESGAALRVEATGGIRFVAATGPKASDVLGVTLPAGTGIVGFTVERGVGLIVTRPHRDPRFFAEMDKVTGYSTESVLCVPVRAPDGGIAGCLELLNAPSSFGRTQLELVEQVAEALTDRLDDE